MLVVGLLLPWGVKMPDFKVGDKVRYNCDFYTESQGTLLTIEDDEGEVQWRNRIGRVGFDEICLANSEEDAKLAKQVQDKLDEAKSAFEKAFEAFNAAQELSGECLYSMSDAQLINLGPLEEVIERSGWSASSLYC